MAGAAAVRRSFLCSRQLSPTVVSSVRNAHFQFVPSTPDPSLGKYVQQNVIKFNPIFTKIKSTASHPSCPIKIKDFE